MGLFREPDASHENHQGLLALASVETLEMGREE